MGAELTPWMTDKLGELLRFADKNGIAARVVSTRRTCAEQNAIYAEGVATKARGCQSWHVWGRAADLSVNGPTEDYFLLGDKWKEMGGVWGGDFAGLQDYGHFEWHPGLKISDVCPDPDACPVPGEAWPEDRPLFARPAVRIVLGVALAAGGITLARRLLSR